MNCISKRFLTSVLVIVSVFQSHAQTGKKAEALSENKEIPKPELPLPDTLAMNNEALLQDEKALVQTNVVQVQEKSPQLIEKPNPIQSEKLLQKSIVPINVAVLPFTSTVLNGDELNAVTLKFMSELNGMKKYSVMERSLMNEILSEQGFQQSGACDDEGCAVEIGRLVAVDKIIAGSVSKIGNVLILNVQVINLETGKNDLIINKEYDGPMSFFISEFVPIAAAEISGVKQKIKKVNLGNKGDTFIYESLKSFLKLKENRIAFGRHLGGAGANLVFSVAVKRSNHINYTGNVGAIAHKVIKENTSGIVALPKYEGPTFILDISYGKDRAHNRMGYQVSLVKDGEISKKQYVGKLTDVPLKYFHLSQVKYSTGNQMILGALIPGAPQISQERLGKGLLIAGLFWGSVGSSIYFYTEFKKARTKYNEYTPLLTDSDDAFNTQYNKYRDMKQYMGYSLISAGVMYLINQLDVFLYTDDVNKYNRYRWRVKADAKRFILEGDF